MEKTAFWPQKLVTGWASYLDLLATRGYGQGLAKLGGLQSRKGTLPLMRRAFISNSSALLWAKPAVGHALRPPTEDVSWLGDGLTMPPGGQVKESH